LPRKEGEELDVLCPNFWAQEKRTHEPLILFKFLKIYIRDKQLFTVSWLMNTTVRGPSVQFSGAFPLFSYLTPTFRLEP